MNSVLKIIGSLVIIITQHVSMAQTEATVVYTMRQDNFEVSRDYILKIKNSEALYEHHQENEVVTNSQGWEYYLNHDFYDWHFDLVKQKITIRKKLEDGTWLTTHYKPDPLNWKITQETSVIAGYKVQKAICTAYHGFQFGEAIAWFTTEIPVNAGPFKYYGLPGLIVELRFSGRYEVFTLKEVTFKPVGKLALSGGIEVDRKQLESPKLLDKKWLSAQKKLPQNQKN